MDFGNSTLIEVWRGDLLEDGILISVPRNSVLRNSDYEKGLLL